MTLDKLQEEAREEYNTFLAGLETVPGYRESLAVFFDKYIARARAEERENIRKFGQENKMADDKTAAFFYGMKVKINPFVPEGEIWFNDGKKFIGAIRNGGDQ